MKEKTQILIFGNSGAGKSTLASHLAKRRSLTHLDLDTLAWEAEQPGTRRPVPVSKKILEDFMQQNSRWVIEGCQGSLLDIVARYCSEMIFLNPGFKVCQHHNTLRPWEAHKYSSPESQNKNLAMLQNWVAEYESRDDEYSLICHKTLFNAFNGKKTQIDDKFNLDNL